MADISFCIPMYNAQKYIDMCLDSIIEQGLEDFEIICIDDCSTDGTFECAHSRAESDPRISVIQNPSNKGVSFSRNVAINNANGKYIWFVDADDFLVPGAASVLLRIAEDNNADIALGKCYAFAEGKKPADIRQGTGNIMPVDLSKPESLYQTDQYGITCYGVWLGIYSKTFLTEHNIYFHEDLALDEDILFQLETIIHSSRRLLVDFYSYYYQIRQSSACRSAEHSDDHHKKYCTCDIRAVDLVLRNPTCCDSRFQIVVNDFIIGRKENCLSHLAKVNDQKYVRETIRELKKKGFYPYKQVPNTSFRKRKKINDWLYIEPVFWLVHFAYSARTKIKNRRT